MPRKDQKTIMVYVSEEELKDLRAAAEKLNENLSWYCLTAAMDKADRVSKQMNRFNVNS